MKNKFSKRVDLIVSSGIRRFFDLVMNSKDVISLGVGEPDFVTPWSIREEAIYSLEKGFTSYTSNQGMLSLRQSISSYLKLKYRLNYSYKNEVLVTVGASEGVDLSLRAIINPGDEVIVPMPTFVSYEPLITLSGGVCVPLDTTDTQFLPDIKQLKSLITDKTKAIILCSPNNPTGAVIPKKILIQIAELAEKYDFWVISDEIYSEICYDDSFSSFGSIPNVKSRCILLNGFSKSFSMTGWRLGFMCGPKPLIDRALKIHQYSLMCASTQAQYGALEALTSDMLLEVQKMVQSYEKRCRFFVSQFEDSLLDLTMPSGAFYCFPSIKRTGLSSEEFSLKLLKEQNVAVIPGTAFGEFGEGYIRCCYATEFDLLKLATERILNFLDSIK